jgi:hypothetical protein
LYLDRKPPASGNFSYRRPLGARQKNDTNFTKD